MQKKSHPGRAFLGFLLTLIITFLLTAAGLLLAARSSVLNGNDMQEVLNNIGFYDAVQSAVSEELYKNTQSIGLSKDAIDELLPAETISKASQKLTDAITNDTGVDLSYLKDDCMNITQKTSEEAINVVFDEIEKSDKIFDAKSLINNPAIKKLESDYGINVSGKVEEAVQQTFGTTVIDLRAIDSAAVKAKVTESVADNLYPAIDRAFDKYINEANNLFNKAIETINKEYKADRIIKTIDNALPMLTIMIIIAFASSAVLFVLELIAYRKSVNRAFRNFSICAALSAIFIFASSAATGFIRDKALGRFSTSNSAEILVRDFLADNISVVADKLVIIGVAYAVIFIACASISVLMKKRYSGENA